MEPRIDLMSNEIGAKFAKRFANASLVIQLKRGASGSITASI